MSKALFLTFFALAAFLVNAQTTHRRAVLAYASDPAEGHCTVSVLVDGAADIEIRGDDATMRNVTGYTPRWQRFDCTGPMPVAAADLSLRAIEGNGQITLSRDPYRPGLSTVRVTNLEGGDRLFTFELSWSPSRPAYSSGEADRSVVDDDAIQSCRTAVENRIRNDGYRYVRFGSVAMDDRGISDRVTGTASASDSYRTAVFDFNCHVSTTDGQVRTVGLTMR
jgi:hypothetical protein